MRDGPRRGPLAGCLLAASALVGCAPTQLVATPAYAPAPSAAAPVLRGADTAQGVSSLANLPGWADEDHAAALAAFQSGCGAVADPAVASVCARARLLGPANETVARTFLEAHFRPVILPGPGLLTAYFAPEYPARSAPEKDFTAALRGRPADLAGGTPDSMAPGGHTPARQIGEDGRTWPYPDRAGIELTPAMDALAYLRPEDLFFLQVQGSGTLVFPDGRRLRASYAADNGRPSSRSPRP